MTIQSISDISAIISQHPPREFHASPTAWEDQLLYFLLPDRFSNGSEKAEDKYNGSQNANAVEPRGNGSAWRDAGRRFVGGTLKGLQSKLRYLKTLGVSAVWIGPIFKQVTWSDTYHGYGVQNFLDVDPRFGTKEELRTLVATAHAMGIYVILDIILNHSGNVFEYKYHDPKYNRGQIFEVKGFFRAENDASLPFGPVDDDNFPDGAIWPRELQHRECFTCMGRIKDGQSWDEKPEFLDGDFYDLKDINLGADEPEKFRVTDALKTLCDIYKYWIAYADIDGYRIDTVKHMGVGPTRYFASAIHEYSHHIGKANFLLVGEITGSEPWKIFESTGLDAALGIQETNIQENLWKVPFGDADPERYFELFRNSSELNEESHTWLRDKVVTILDDHDQVWKSDNKGRFCSVPNNDRLVASALMMNLCTLGIPCIYYGTEQAFDGSGSGDNGDRYIREAMFGGTFGAFRSKDAHFFNDQHDVYKAVREVARIRDQETALRRGQQYLRDVSGDGEHFGPTRKQSGDRIQGVVAWSRLHAGIEVLCAINTDPVRGQYETWVNVDAEIHPPRSHMRYLIPANEQQVEVELRGGRSAVRLSINPGGFVILK